MGYRFNMKREDTFLVVYQELPSYMATLLASKYKWGYRSLEWSIFGELDYCLYYGMPRRELTSGLPPRDVMSPEEILEYF